MSMKKKIEAVPFAETDKGYGAIFTDADKIDGAGFKTGEKIAFELISYECGDESVIHMKRLTPSGKKGVDLKQEVQLGCGNDCGGFTKITSQHVGPKGKIVTTEKEIGSDDVCYAVWGAFYRMDDEGDKKFSPEEAVAIEKLRQTIAKYALNDGKLDAKETKAIITQANKIAAGKTR